MCTFIIYCHDDQFVSETLHDLIDKTPPAHLKQIIICDEKDLLNKDKLPLTHWDYIFHTNNIGKSRAYNFAAETATENTLIFLQAPTKFSQDWLPPLLEQLPPTALRSPTAYNLDTNLWASENKHWTRYGLRWDFTVHNRKFRPTKWSPLAANCLVINKEFFHTIHGFDQGSQIGPGDNICLSLKTWMAGGEVQIIDNSHISIIPETNTNNHNLARLVEAWFPKHTTHFYNAIDQKPTNIGRIDQLIQFTDTIEHDTDWWIENLQPELLGTMVLRGTAHGKRIAVVGDGPSLNYTTPSMINSHDIVIGVDYVHQLFDCDYVVSQSVDVVSQLEIPFSRLVVPIVLEHRVAGQFVSAMEVVPGAIQLELGEFGQLEKLSPPFCNFDNTTLLALHFALFLGPSTITLFGCDNKIIDGRSHTSLLEQYDSGEIWADSEQTRNKFNFYEVGLGQLGKLALQLNIPILRVGHV